METANSISDITEHVVSDHSGLQTIESLVALMIVVTIVGMLARKIKLPYTVSLVLAGLISRKKTKINRIYHLDRGYEKLEAKLVRCGANVKRQKHEK